jgi:hypothetical protein
MILPNVQDEPRPWLARLVLLGARDVTAMVVGSGALLGGSENTQALKPPNRNEKLGHSPELGLSDSSAMLAEL